MSRAVLRAVVAASAGLALVFGASPAATAAPGDGAFPGVDLEQPGAQPAPNAPVTRQVRTCSLYAGGGSYGMTCRGGASASASYADILGGDPVPDCWHEAVAEDFRPPRHTPDELDADGNPKPGRWWLRTCLIGGIDPVTKQSTGRLRFSQEPEYLVRPEEPVQLTPNQALVLAGQRGPQRQIPEPFAATSPSETPRVGQYVAFYVPPSQRSGETISVSGPGIGTVSMRARMTELVVEPLGRGAGPRVSCPGGGVRVQIGETRTTTPDACWYQFDRSSAHRADGVYPGQVEARWVVEYEAGEGWTELGAFTRVQVIDQPVTEVQTIVVP